MVVGNHRRVEQADDSHHRAVVVVGSRHRVVEATVVVGSRRRVVATAGHMDSRHRVAATGVDNCYRVVAGLVVAVGHHKTWAVVGQDRWVD